MVVQVIYNRLQPFIRSYSRFTMVYNPLSGRTGDLQSFTTLYQVLEAIYNRLQPFISSYSRFTIINNPLSARKADLQSFTTLY